MAGKSGEEAPVKRRRSQLPFAMGGQQGTAPRRAFRRLRPGQGQGGILLALLGIVLAGGGIYLGATSPPISVYRTGTTVVVGTASLSAQGKIASSGAGTYLGGGVLVIRDIKSGQEEAGGSAQVGGVNQQGSCQYFDSAAVINEHCSFVVGGQSLTAEDRLGAGGIWQRTYSDGQKVEMVVPAGKEVVPIPFAVGR